MIGTCPSNPSRPRHLTPAREKGVVNPLAKYSTVWELWVPALHLYIPIIIIIPAIQALLAKYSTEVPVPTLSQRGNETLSNYNLRPALAQTFTELATILRALCSKYHIFSLKSREDHLGSRGKPVQ